MRDLSAPANGGRGTALLLVHCRALTRVDDARVPAFRRLELAVGCDLARLLTGALAGHGREHRLAA
jgi:hypothetical protein